MALPGKTFFVQEPRLIRGISLYLENDNGEFLLQLRTDDAPRFPSYRAPPSGALEAGENPESCLKREMREELGITVSEPVFVRDYLWYSPEGSSLWYNHNFLFWAETRIPIEEMVLGEGARIDFFPLEEIEKMNLAFNHNETFRDLLLWKTTRI